jgi:hypothetical protein
MLTIQLYNGMWNSDVMSSEITAFQGRVPHIVAQIPATETTGTRSSLTSAIRLNNVQTNVRNRAHAFHFLDRIGASTSRAACILQDSAAKDKVRVSYKPAHLTPDMAALVHKLATLSGFGRGVLASISVMKERLEGVGTRPECMTDARLAPVRKHFANHFPALLPEKVRLSASLCWKWAGVYVLAPC